jgi:hypothetical protein
VALIDYPGNANPEPGAWARMAKLARATCKMDVQLSTVKIGELDAKKFPLAHLTGTTRVFFTPDDALKLKAYLDAGGLLFADAAGGSAEFAESVKELLKNVYPEAGLAPLPLTHPVYQGSMADGVRIGEVEFRKYGNFKLHRRVTTPALEEIAINGKTRVIFSAWDVSSGYLGTNTWGILGYAPASAQALGRNILLYAANPAAAAPTDAKQEAKGAANSQ